MATQQRMLSCKACGKRTLHLVQKPSHLLHLVLSVVTVGMWLIVWVGLMLVGGQAPECTVCGKKRGAFGWW